MTTLAYHHKDGHLAFDSRVSSGSHICTDRWAKAFYVGDSLMILAGSLSDIDIFRSEYPNIETELACSGYVIEKDGFYGVGVVSGVLKKFRVTFNDADGSGYAFAVAAMDFGKTAAEAVRYAMTRDTATGGAVTVINVPKHISTLAH